MLSLEAVGRIRLERRLGPRSRTRQGGQVVIGIVIAVALGALLLTITDHAPVQAYRAMWRGGFGSARAWQVTLEKATPIALCALGIALARRAGLWNIGAEGQLLLGAFAATGIGLALPANWPGVVVLPMLGLAAAAAGAVWAALAGIGRAVLGVNEIVSTLLLVYVAEIWVRYLVFGPWADPTTFSFPYSRPLPPNYRLQSLWGSMHAGPIVVVAAALAVGLVVARTRWGFEGRVTGDSQRAALYGGMPVRTVLITTMAASGALAGLAGMIEVSGVSGRLQEGLSPGYGFIGILVAWLAVLRPAAIVVASIAYAGLLNGGFSLQVSGIPAAIGGVLQAFILLAVIATQSLGRYRLRLVPRVGVDRAAEAPTMQELTV